MNTFGKKFTIKRVVLALVLVIATMTAMPKMVSYASENQDGNNMKKVIECYKNKNYEEADKYNKKLPKYAKEKCVKKMSKAMKKAYKQVVKKNKKILWDYFYTDFDNDGKAELIIQKGTCEADVMYRVFKFSKGKATLVGKMYAAHSVISAYPKNNGVVINSGHMGHEELKYAYLKNGKIKCESLGERDTEDYFIPRCMLKGKKK